MKVIVGGIVEKDGKYLLVQEAQKKCYEKWNIPAGHLDFGESLVQGAEREIKEETGCDVKVNGIAYIANKVLEDDLFVMIIFTTELLNEKIEYDKNEILDVKWYSYDEIENKINHQLRGQFILDSIKNMRDGFISPIEVIDVLKN